MKSLSCSVVLAGLLGTIGALESVSAAVILNDSFDSYVSQAAFEADWVPIGTTAPISGLLSLEQAVSGTTSIKINGTATNNQQRNRRTISETGSISLNNAVVFSIDFYDSLVAGTPGRNYVNLQDGTTGLGENQLISLGLNNTQLATESGGNFYMARILGHTLVSVDPDGGPVEDEANGSSGIFIKLNDFGVGLRSLGWHNLKVVISTDDGLSSDYAFYVDNQLAELVSNVGTTVRSYDNVTLGSGLSNSSTAVYFDNANVTTVPEPASLMMLGFGGAFCLLRRRWR